MQRAEVELFVAAEGRFGCALGFSEGWRIEDDGVERLGFFLIEMAEILEGVGFNPIDFGFQAWIECEIAVRRLESRTAGVDARDACANLREMQSEAAVVSAHVER